MKVLFYIAMVFVIVCAMAAIQGCGVSSAGADDAAGQEALSVFAAASTAEAVSELARAYSDRTGRPVEVNLAASSTLARQIESGAPADVYLSAHPAWMDRLGGQGLLRPGTRRDLLINRLVVVCPADRLVRVRADRAFDLAGAFDGRLAMGDPDHVPAGAYARQALRNMGWWRGVASRLAPAADVRRALALVELGEADLGIVYATDAARSERVRVAATFAAETHEPIRYPVAVCRDAVPGAEDFAAFLAGPEGQAVFLRYGFALPGGP